MSINGTSLVGLPLSSVHTGLISLTNANIQPIICTLDS